MAHQDKVYIVTGGGSGIGYTTAVYLANQGARVGVLDLSRALSFSHASIVFEECDVSNSELVDKVVQKIVQGFGQRLDGVVNCAGVHTGPESLHNVSDKSYTKTMDVNVRGTFNVMRAAIPFLRTGGRGSIVNISSGAGIRGVPYEAIYCASKFAVIGLTKAAAIEYAKENIRINVVAPGPVDTPLLWSVHSEREKVVAATPIGRVIEQQEVANVIAFLLSEQSSAVTGSVYSVDGGWAS